MTPPPMATVPVPCLAPEVRSRKLRSLHVAWKEPDDDGGDSVYRYVLELAEIAPGNLKL